jgi:hypothetical protein
MSPTIPTAACPHCAGVSGFNYLETLIVNVNSGWGGGGHDWSASKVLSVGEPTCEDCGKSVKALFKKPKPKTK